MSSGQPNKKIIEPSYMPLRGAAAHAVFRRPDVFRCPCWKFAHSAIVQLRGSSWAWSEFAHGLIRGQIRPIAPARRTNAYSPSAQLQRHCCLAPGIFPIATAIPLCPAPGIFPIATPCCPNPGIFPIATSLLPGSWNIPNCNATTRLETLTQVGGYRRNAWVVIAEIRRKS